MSSDMFIHNRLLLSNCIAVVILGNVVGAVGAVAVVVIDADVIIEVVIGVDENSANPQTHGPFNPQPATTHRKPERQGKGIVELVGWGWRVGGLAGWWVGVLVGWCNLG